MERFIIFVSLFIAGSCSASPRIVDGSNAAIETYPSIVQVEFQGVASGTWSQNCAGVILNNIFVLSAANCFDGPLYDPSLRRIRAGAVQRNQGGVVVNILQATNHPDFGKEARFDADITVVRLDGFLFFSTVINQASLPEQGSVLGEHHFVVKAGWGRTEDGGPHAETLQQIIVPVVNSNVCRQNYAGLPIPGVVTNNMVCAGFLGFGGFDTCEGDAGGPLYLGNAVVGIISWGHGCGNPDFPGVSTLVPAFTNWILQVAS